MNELNNIPHTKQDYTQQSIEKKYLNCLGYFVGKPAKERHRNQKASELSISTESEGCMINEFIAIASASVENMQKYSFEKQLKKVIHLTCVWVS